MPVSDFEMVQAWKQVLTLSRLEPGQIVTVLTSQSTNPQTLSTAIIAAGLMQAKVNRLDLPPLNGEKALSRDPFAYLGTTPLSGNAAAIAALKESDIVLDLMTLLFSPEQHEILASGTKILLAVEPPEILARLVPTLADKERVARAAGLLTDGKRMHVTSAAGTDVRFQLGQYPAIQEYGFVDQPGRWDHWPSGFVLTWPNEGSATGRVVVNRGDILLPQKSYVSEPIVMTVEAGFVTAIDGGLDAELLNEYMASFSDPEAYAFSHLGWGLQPRAKWSALQLYDREGTVAQDARAYEGNFLFSLGPNNEAGGSRTTACHIDIPLRSCTIRIDDNIVVRDGKILDNP
jgi:2,5-dihydroxypyridine 5,6-dioxygenase